MINEIFSTPIYECKMPDHERLKEAFRPFSADDANFATPVGWSCNADSTFGNEPIAGMPWDKFFNSVLPLVEKYVNDIGGIGEYSIGCQAWMNRYNYGQHQEVHAHSNGSNVISCAYMLEKPENSGDFVFYKSSNDFFQKVNLQTEIYGNKYVPEMTEGSIVLFPSSLDHYVTYNQTQATRVTISANFAITF